MLSMKTAKDIDPDGEIVDMAVKVLDVSEAPDYTDVKYFIDIRDVDGQTFDFVIFENNPEAKWTWKEGEWYYLENAYAHHYDGPQVKPPRDGVIDIEPLDRKPTSEDTDTDDDALVDESGATMLQTQLTDSLETIEVHEHKIQLAEGFQGDAEKFTARVAHRYRTDQETPVTSFGVMRLVAPQRLSGRQYVDDYEVSVEHLGTKRLVAKEAGHRSTIATLVKQDIKQALAGDPQYDVLGIDKIIEREPALTASTDGFTAHRKYGVRVRVDPDGDVLCGIHVSHRFMSDFTADEFMAEGHDISGVTVEHDPRRYRESGSAEVLGTSEFHYTDPVPELGGTSVREFHENHDRVDPQTAQRVAESDPKMLYVDYDGDAENPEDGNLQAPQYLRIIPTLDKLKELAPAFHQRAVSTCRIDPSRRLTLAHEFVSRVGHLPGLGTQMGTTFSTKKHDHVAVDTDQANLEFGGGARNRVASWELTDSGVYQAPEDFAIQVLVPTDSREDGVGFAADIERNLNSLGAAPDRYDVDQYDLGSRFEYSDVLAAAADYDAVLAVVPAPETANKAAYDDPFDVFKRRLGTNGVPSQMATKPEIVNADDDTLLNISLGLIAGAGGVPWRIAELPGSADAFIGLDVHYSHADGQHIGASANLVLADGTVFNSRAIQTQNGEKFAPEEVENAVGDILHHYIRETGEQFDHLVILRDGRLHVDIDALEEKFTGLEGSVSIADVQKSGAPRIVNANLSGASVAPKGTGFVHTEDDHAVLATTGDPEPVPGTPQPLRIEKRSGPVEMDTLCKQLYWLSEAHVGSATRSTRLPVPVYYADLCAEAAAKGHIVSGEIVDGLPFL